MEVGRPQNSSSRSRKGKRSWRKNIDLEDIQQGLEEAREKEILLGNDLEGDFIIDSAGDSNLGGKNVKKLKSSEILTNKSKVDALDSERNRRRIQGVKKQEIHRLMKLSGRVQGESKLVAQVDADGLCKASSEDVWAEEPLSDVPDVLAKSSITSFTRAKTAPIKKEPIRLADTVSSLSSGKSYNPSLESWRKLINDEYKSEYAREMERQSLIEYQEKIKGLIDDIQSEEEDDDDDQPDHETNEDGGDTKLSINAPVKVKIKSKARRNKEAKHKKRQELEAKLSQLKSQIKELSKVDEYTKIAEAKKVSKPKSKKKPTKLFKYDVVKKPLEVKLSDELTSNLKNVKSEGNLFYDTMINLQESGKIEARIPITKKRKYKPKITEKWTYKDFK